MLDSNEVRKIVIDFVERQKKFKLFKGQFEQVKKTFNAVMSEYFEQCSIPQGTGIVFENEFSVSPQESKLKVSKVQRAKVIFDVSKLKKVLSKNLLKKVVNKKYEITDIRGLTEYLKELDADPQIFKQFIAIEETINEERLDYLVEIGELEKSQIGGCFRVEVSEPYFTVKEVGGKDWDSIPGF